MKDAGRRRLLLAAGALCAGAWPARVPAVNRAERDRLLADGERHLSRLELDAARDCFENAALLEHAGDIEMGLVRTYLQSGDFRSAMAFLAHTAAAHHDEPAAGALYAWLLHCGGQEKQAGLVLERVASGAPDDPAVTAVRDCLNGVRGAQLPMRVPERFAPYDYPPVPADGTKAVGSGLLIRSGQQALVPMALIQGRSAVWLRNGLGHTSRARIDHEDEATGLALVALDAPMPAPPALAQAERAAFAGSVAYGLHYPVQQDGTPAWPQMVPGFMARRSGLEMSLGGDADGGVVFDRVGRWTGVFLRQRAPGWGAGLSASPPAAAVRTVSVPALKTVFGADLLKQMASPEQVSTEAVYERGMRLVLQVVIAA